MWEAGSPFGLTSLKLLTVVIAVGLASIVYLLWRLNRRTERAKGLARALDVLLYTTGVVLPVLAVMMMVNRSGGFYNSFAELAEQIAQLGG